MGRWVLAALVFMQITQLVLCIVTNEAGIDHMESDTARRLFQMQQNRRYISYELLRADFVPCSKLGVLYYNCHESGAGANAYRRGCGTISRCARYESP